MTNISKHLKNKTDKKYEGRDKVWWLVKELSRTQVLKLSFTNPHPWAYYIAKEEGGDV